MRCLYVFFAVAISASAQSAAGPQDSATTQALIAEIRLLRQDLQNTAAAIQRAQIVMFRLQTEAQSLNRAIQRADEARGRCADLEHQRREIAGELQRLEERQRMPQGPPDQGLAENIVHLKAGLESLGNDQQQCQAREIEAGGQLRDEQAKMNELQDQLDKLDKTLAGNAR
jgi:chromosome segregation ATPase